MIMIMMMIVNDLVATTVVDVPIYCSSLVLKAQKVNTKTTANDLVVVGEREEEEIIMGATTTTTTTILYLLRGWEWSVM